MAWGNSPNTQILNLDSSFLTGRVISIDQTTTNTNGVVLVEVVLERVVVVVLVLAVGMGSVMFGGDGIV